ncbi:MAG: VWA domain-containing protein [Pirellulaceae bacterium]
MKLSCFYCGNELTATAQQLGGEVVCPHCQKVIRLPEAEPEQEAEEHPPFSIGNWLTSSISGLTSMVVHMLMLVLFAAVTCDYRSGMPEGEVVAIGELPSVDLSDSGGDVLETTEAETEESESIDLEQLLEDVAPPTADTSDSGDVVDISQMLPSGAAGASGSMETIGGGGAAALGSGASFMGLRAEGGLIMIIADYSGSMSGPRMDFLKQEVIEAIDSMSRETRFQILFFNTGARQFPEPGWRSPTRDREKVVNWLRQVNSGGGTDPLPAFEAAFKFSPPPDAVFFMTDGLFDAGSVDLIRNLNVKNGGRTKIHTISFIDQSAEAIMRRIANDSGGKYRHVSGF